MIYILTWDFIAMVFMIRLYNTLDFRYSVVVSRCCTLKKPTKWITNLAEHQLSYLFMVFHKLVCIKPSNKNFRLVKC